MTARILSVALLAASVASPAAARTLADAMERQDKTAVRALLQQGGVDVDAPQPDGATALHWAVHWDDRDAVQLLLRAGANPNAATDYGVTPLALACENANAALVQELLKAGANPNATRITGETVLMTAAWTGDVDVVKLLIDRGADVNTKEATKGHTALMWAVSENHTDVARLLVDRGADVKARSADGSTPLIFAARMGDLESARLFLSRGSSAGEEIPDGPSALVVATVRGHVALALYLLEQGADPDAAGAGYTALHWATGSWETQNTGRNGLTAPSVDHEWHWLPGLRSGRLELVKGLLAKGANPNARIVTEPKRIGFSRRNTEGRELPGATPFLLSAQAGLVDVMQALIAAGADPNLTTNGDMTPLMAAAGVGRVVGETFTTPEMSLAAARLALELGNDINAVNDHGETALHGAAHMKHDALVEYLADKGADLNVKTTKATNNWDHPGQTPLEYAERHLQYMASPVYAKTSTGDLLRKLGAQQGRSDPGVRR